MDKDKDDAFRRSILFAISLIEAPQAATAMVEIAKKAGGETAKLASVFIDKRDQGIWNPYKAKDQLSGKPAGPTVYTSTGSPRWNSDRRPSCPRHPRSFPSRETPSKAKP